MPNIFVQIFNKLKKSICLTSRMYLSKITIIFIQINKCICVTSQMYLSNLVISSDNECCPTHSVSWHQKSVQIAKFMSILSTCKIYLSKITIIFIQINKCICLTSQMYLSNLVRSSDNECCPTHSVRWHQRSDEGPADGDPPLLYPLLPLSLQIQIQVQKQIQRDPPLLYLLLLPLSLQIQIQCRNS